MAARDDNRTAHSVSRVEIMSLRILLCMAVWLGVSGSSFALDTSGPNQPWRITRDIPIVSHWWSGNRDGEDTIAADLYRPTTDGRAPAAVIINSSGGVSADVELYYARILARSGVAALVVDSFTPRGVHRTGDDQNRVWQDKSNADAIAGYRWLAKQEWVDSTRILVIGLSRGGETAISTALQVLLRKMHATDVRFAAHVAIAPGGCNFQFGDVRTTGAPIFFMEAELDDGTPAMPCIELIQRMRAAGNQNLRFAVYPGVYHAFELTSGIENLPQDWTGRDCAGRFFRDENFRLRDRATGKSATQEQDQTDFLFKTCLKKGYTIGGEQRVKDQATADLLQFLRDVDFVHDREALALVPDCKSFPDDTIRRSCVRARNGWTADIVGTARVVRIGSGIKPDASLAAKLYELAAARGNSEAKWQLAVMYWRGSGVSADPVRALQLAKESADLGDAAGINLYGVMIRDGIGRSRNDREALPWFQMSADLRNSFGMTNLGMFYWYGRAGLPLDRSEAVKLWNRAVFRGDNPWAHVFLARAFEAGEHVAIDRKLALDHYKAAAAQDREPEARLRGEEGVARLTGAR